jgi:TRAP transporter TAXI family solute receptor
MKTKIVQLMFIVMSLMLIAAGCGGASDGASGKGQKDQGTSGENGSTSMKVTIAGGSAGGSWSVIGEGIGETVKRSYPGSTFTYQPGQDGANVITVTRGEVPFGIVTFPAAKWAYEGKVPYDSKIENVRVVAYLHSMPYHFVVRKDAGIDSIEQIGEENLPFVASVNTKNSPMEITNQIVFDSYGTSYEEIEQNGGEIHFQAISKSTSLMRDNKIDALLSPLPTPASYLSELNSSKPIKLLSLSDKAIKDLEDQVGAIPTTIKAGTYEFVKKDVPTAAVSTVLITSADVPDEKVYKLTKAVYEHLDFLHSVHNSFKDMTKETMANLEGVPFHPGAAKFYKEVGIMEE